MEPLGQMLREFYVRWLLAVFSSYKTLFRSLYFEEGKVGYVRRIEQCIDRGERVVIWPNHISEKDINDMVLGGHNVQSVLECNTYSGLEAKLNFNNWKRI